MEKIAHAVGKYTSPAPRIQAISTRLVVLPSSRTQLSSMISLHMEMTSGLSVNNPISCVLSNTPTVQVTAMIARAVR